MQCCAGHDRNTLDYFSDPIYSLWGNDTGPSYKLPGVNCRFPPHIEQVIKNRKTPAEKAGFGPEAGWLLTSKSKNGVLRWEDVKPNYTRKIDPGCTWWKKYMSQEEHDQIEREQKEYFAKLEQYNQMMKNKKKKKK